jgi:Zn-finger nucleic acid-binding protein
MTHVLIGEVHLAECPDCDGLWLEAEAFERLCATREARAAFLHRAVPAPDSGAAPRPDRVRYRPCPRCRKLMNRVNFGRASGIILDVCRGHGTFLDPGEMRRVTTFIDTGGLDLARDRERQSLVEEQRRLRALQDGPAARLSHDVRVVEVRDGALAEFFAALFNR